LAVNVSNPTRKWQWIQLGVLSGVHFLVDMFANMLPAILPAVRENFALSLSWGGLVLASLTLTSNGMQLLTGHLRAKKRRPLFLYLGLFLATSICIMALAPRSGVGVALVIVLGVASGSGIAIAHPEGLRAIHTLNRIPPALSTAVFMTAGFLGYANGGAISSLLVSRFGLRGLCPLLLCPLVGAGAIALSRVRLSVEEDHAENGGSELDLQLRLPFGKVMLIGLPAAVSSTVIVFLLPSHLNELGFALTFGGFSTAMFGWGGTVGPFVWALLAHRKGELWCSGLAFLLSVPFLVLYFPFIENRVGVWMLFGAGFFSMSGYILTITLARHARGLNLGQRMAFIVGGTWGIANIVFLGLAPLAEHFGTTVILKCMPLGYLLSGLLALWVKLTSSGGKSLR
jgi:FSR family fosmidomycin resistance protein-like MFS transporter